MGVYSAEVWLCNHIVRLLKPYENPARENYRRAGIFNIMASDVHDALERVFYLTNSFPGYHDRSLSVGDVVVLDGQAYMCLPVGWKKVEFVRKDTNLSTI